MRAMKLLFSFLLILSSLTFPGQAQEISDRERDGLSDQVAGVLSEYTFVDEEDGRYVESRRYHRQATAYDINGKKIFETPLEACDACSILKAKYDEKGRVIEESFYSPRSNALEMRIVHSYDSAGKPIGEDHYDVSGKLYRKWKYTYEYDSYGNWIKQTALMNDPKFFDGKEGFIPRQITYRNIAYH